MEDHNIDFVISPTTIGEAPMKIDDVLNNKTKAVSEYKMDFYTTFPNSIGIPSATIPI
jgi:Asp-tRNA(Asn)/Glu-tRNA(Gln) amidotransferase A subunit family amidase